MTFNLAMSAGTPSHNPGKHQKELQLHEILKFTQQQTLNSSQLIDQLGVKHAETTKNARAGSIGSNLTDDFLKKIKMQHESLKQTDQRGSGKLNESELLRQQLG